MARLPRLYAPRIPQLVQARLARPLSAPGDPAPAALLDKIQEWLAGETRQHAIALHAWTLLPERITLLLTPGDERAAARLMQALGRRMGSGLLRARVYAGRYHNALLEPGRWVLPAMLAVETLAVVKREVDQAVRWPWSSAAEHAGLEGPGPRPPLEDHPDYWRIGDTPFARQAAWRQHLLSGLPESQRLALEAAVHGQWALGEKIFLAHLGRLASRRVSPAPRGRPRKAGPDTKISRVP
ncbi:Putative transposase OS=Castellaniella defragrans OX=75697 GN=HNR28_002118 PE=4 SV=1 [Castellaniella defragrans]